MFTIRYRDSKGEMTQRDIAHIKFIQDGDPVEDFDEEPPLFRAYCHLRGEPRTFWVNRIESMVEKNTGRAIESEHLIHEIETPFFKRIKIQGEWYDPYQLLELYDPDCDADGAKNRQLIKRHLGKMDQDYRFHLIMALKTYKSPAVKKLTDFIINPSPTPTQKKKVGDKTAEKKSLTPMEGITCAVVLAVIVLLVVLVC